MLHNRFDIICLSDGCQTADAFKRVIKEMWIELALQGIKFVFFFAQFDFVKIILTGDDLAGTFLQRFKHVVCGIDNLIEFFNACLLQCIAACNRVKAIQLFQQICNGCADKLRDKSIEFKNIERNKDQEKQQNDAI